MSWVAVGVGVVGAVGSAYSANKQNQAAKAGSKGAGTVDITHRSDPYGNSIQYRDDIASRAGWAIDGMQYQQPGGGGSGRATAPAGMRINRAGKVVKPRNGGGGSGAVAGSSAPAFNGQSQETAAAIANASRVAGDQEHGAITTAAQGYGADTLNGIDRNGYRGESADMLRDLDDPDLQRYKDMLFGSLNGPGGGGAGLTPTDFTGFYQSNGHGGTVMPQTEGAGPVGAAGYLHGILEGEDAPGAQAMRDRIRHNADDAFNEQTRQRRLEAAGSGMYGGTGQLADEAYAQGKYGAGLADAYAAQDYGLYQQALGLGTQYDSAALDRASSERNASLSASTSAGNNAASIASQQQLARLGMLGDAVGMGVQQGQFRASGMGSLAEGFSSDQRAAAGEAHNTVGLGQQGYLNAGSLAGASDQNRNNFIGNANQLRAAQMSSGNARAALAFDQYRYNREAPLADLARYSDIINGAYGGYGVQTEYGNDRRSSSPPAYVSPVGQAIAGGVAGYQLGSQYANSRGSGGTGVVGTNPGATGGTPGNIW